MTNEQPLRIGEAIDMWIGELSRRNRSVGTLDEYRRRLNLLADDVRDAYVHQVTLRDYERFLDRWLHKAPSTMASGSSRIASAQSTYSR